MILSLDTATDRPTIALGTPGEPGSDAVIAHRHDLSRDIDAVVASLLAERGVSARRIERVVVADGPGSFTGLRIGVAFAKGLARALGIPLLAAPSLLGAARAVATSGVVVVSYDALRGDSYRAVYRIDAAGVTVLAAPAVTPSSREDARFGGAAQAGAAHASAAALLRLVGVAGGPMEVTDAAAWEPSYGRPAEAEARRLARHG